MLCLLKGTHHQGSHNLYSFLQLHLQPTSTSIQVHQFCSMLLIISNQAQHLQPEEIHCVSLKTRPSAAAPIRRLEPRPRWVEGKRGGSSGAGGHQRGNSTWVPAWSSERSSVDWGGGTWKYCKKTGGFRWGRGCRVGNVGSQCCRPVRLPFQSLMCVFAGSSRGRRGVQARRVMFTWVKVTAWIHVGTNSARVICRSVWRRARGSPD